MLHVNISKLERILEGKGFDPRKLLAPGAEAIKATVKEKMELFGSVGKAEQGRSNRFECPFLIIN